MNQKLRSEINEKDTWDLKAIYKSEDEFHKDVNAFPKKLESLISKKKSFTSDAKSLLEFLEQYCNLYRNIEKIYTYAKLSYDADIMESHSQELLGIVENLSQTFECETTFIKPALMKKNKTWFDKLVKEDKQLEKYKYFMSRIFKEKKHQISEKEESLLSSFSKVFSASSKIYRSLTDGDLQFGYVKDETGKEVELNESNYTSLVCSSKKEVRKEAFEKILKGYQNHIQSISNMLEAQVENHVTIAKTYKYPSAMVASLSADEVTTKVYGNLIETVNKNLIPSHEYFEYKRKCLGLKEVHLYDLYAPIVGDLKKEYNFEEAKNLVLNAMSILGEEYQKDLKKAFDERWIDKYNNKGKRKGAYSSGCYDTYPYVLLNYEGKLEDVFTLAHELGHSMHTYYSHKENEYINADYRIFVAEVASTTNELLLADYLLKHSDDKQEKKYIIDALLKKYKGTLYRQTMFAEFEKEIHEKKERGEALTPEYLCNMYYELNKKYFGDKVIIDDEIRYEWARIPHFYYNFYVYKYATGISAATMISKNIIEKKPNALQNYLKFLSLGGSMSPLDELKVAGVDLTKKEVIEKAISHFEYLLEEMKKLDKE